MKHAKDKDLYQQGYEVKRVRAFARHGVQPEKIAHILYLSLAYVLYVLAH